MKISGIYQIHNLNTGKSYIGSAKDIKQRWRDHKKRLRKGNHHSRHLQASWNKHGENAWEWLVLELCSIEKLVEREQVYIDQFDSYQVGYNMTPLAANTSGIKHSIQARAKVAEANRHRVWTDEMKANVSRSSKGRTAWNKGIPFAEEVKAKLRISARRQKSPEHLARVIAHCKQLGLSRKGIPLSKAHRDKIRPRVGVKRGPYRKSVTNTDFLQEATGVD